MLTLAGVKKMNFSYPSDNMEDEQNLEMRLAIAESEKSSLTSEVEDLQLEKELLGNEIIARDFTIEGLNAELEACEAREEANSVLVEKITKEVDQIKQMLVDRAKYAISPRTAEYLTTEGPMLGDDIARELNEAVELIDKLREDKKALQQGLTALVNRIDVYQARNAEDSIYIVPKHIYSYLNDY